MHAVVFGFCLTPPIPDSVAFYNIRSCLWKTLLKLLELNAQSARPVGRFLLLSCCQLHFVAFMRNVSHKLRTIHNGISLQNIHLATFTESFRADFKLTCGEKKKSNRVSCITWIDNIWDFLLKFEANFKVHPAENCFMVWKATHSNPLAH